MNVNPEEIRDLQDVTPEVDRTLAIAQALLLDVTFVATLHITQRIAA